MAKQRHIGFVIFGACCALSARIAIFEPKPTPENLTPAEERWGTHQADNSDPLGLIHGLRFYIYGLGVLGLLMVVEDYYGEKSQKRKRTDSQQPSPKKQSDESKADS
jgi:hypothetical protein